jgi:acetyl-CoA synthetase
VDDHIDVANVVPVPKALQPSAHIRSFEAYKALYDYSIKNPEEFWRKAANEVITWFHPFTEVMRGSFEAGDITWFLNGKLNVCYNCVDRHVATQGEKVAIIHEGNEPGDVRRITYRQLLSEVCRMANALKSVGVRKGDSVCIYMPMVPEAVYAMLACARIGALHTLVFAGFSAEALSDRINDAKAQVLVTSNEGKRGTKTIPLKETVDEALKNCPTVRTVLVHTHTATPPKLTPGRDVLLHDLLVQQRPYCPCEWLDSEDGLFLLYTSGSTGKPKGVMHTQAGYLLFVALTHRYIFDIQPHDVYACMADVGWITGHSYIVYGPLANGSTTVLFESTPLYPGPERYWETVQRLKITIFYTAPTAIRALMKFGDEPVQKYDRSSLRILGSVGEPINPAAWEWYYRVVGEGRCAVVDTYWQTETGGIMISPLPGAIPTKPGSATLPFFGIRPSIIDAKTGQPIPQLEAKGLLVFDFPWPGIARTLYGSHERYLSAYMTPYPGHYLTGDECYRDKDGYYWIIGRVDDVMNISGHRLGTAEVESALVSHPACAEAAVIAVPHPIKGQAILAYCCLKENVNESPSKLIEGLKLQVRKKIGPIAIPDRIVLVPGLPKTRSGKIMRRILRKIAAHETAPEQLGDITTLAEPNIVEQIIHLYQEAEKVQSFQ